MKDHRATKYVHIYFSSRNISLMSTCDIRLNITIIKLNLINYINLMIPMKLFIKKLFFFNIYKKNKIYKTDIFYLISNIVKFNKT